MKSKAQPCLNNYLTIHVPATALLNEYRSRKSSDQIQSNPFMNKKLQQIKEKQKNKKMDIAFVYSTLPSRSFGKKKKMESIPLLMNMRSSSDAKLRIVKESNKNVYNLVFEKKKAPNKQIQSPPKRQLLQEKDNFLLSHQNSKKNVSRNFFSSQGSRKSSFGLENFRNTHQIKISDTQLRNNLIKSQQLTISGMRAPSCQSADHLRKNSSSAFTYELMSDIYGQQEFKKIIF